MANLDQPVVLARLLQTPISFLKSRMLLVNRISGVVLLLFALGVFTSAMLFSARRL